MKTLIKLLSLFLILYPGHADGQFREYKNMAHASWHMSVSELGRIDKFELLTYVIYNDKLCGQKLLEDGTYGKIPFDEADYRYIYFTYQDGSSRVLTITKYEYLIFTKHIRLYREVNRFYY